MSKNKITDFSTTRSSNTDIGGVGIAGSNNARNVDDAIREMMAQLAKMNAGTDPLNDTFAVADPTDATKKVRLDAGNVAPGNTRVLTMPDTNVNISSYFASLTNAANVSAFATLIGAGTTFRQPRLLLFASNTTYTPTAGARFIIVLGVAGGGGGGGVSLTAQSRSGGGGAGGAFLWWSEVDAALQAGTSITIGSGGLGRTFGAEFGNAGGATSFGSYASANGGGGGERARAANVAILGGVGGTAIINSGQGIAMKGNSAPNAYFTGGGGGSGAPSIFGGAAPNTIFNQSGGVDGGAPGAGGGGENYVNSTYGTVQQGGGDGAGGVTLVLECF